MKRWLLGLTLLGVGVGAGAGPLSAQVLTLGVKGGATFASVEDADGTFDDVGQRTGSVFGASVKLGGRPVGVRAEVLLVQKGFEAENEGTDVLFEVDYVELPLLLVVQLSSGSVRPSIYGGAAVGFERDCTLTLTGTQGRASGDCDSPNFETERETMDAGAVFGGEVAVALGGVDVVVDGRYTMGLTTLDAEDDPNDIRNRAFLLMAGLEIPIG